MGNDSLSLALVTETWPPEVNGVAMTLSRLAHGLAGRHWQVQLVRPRQGNPAAPGDEALEHVLVPSLPIPGYAGLRFGLPRHKALVESWSGNRPDVVHIATEGPLGWSALHAARSLAIPVTTSFHTNFHSYCRHYRMGLFRRMVSGYLRYFHNKSNSTLVPNDSLRATMAADGYRNVATLGRGVDTALFHPSRRDAGLRAQWGASESDIVVIHVGRIAPEKNLSLVVAAFEALQRELSSARLVWVGDGPILAAMRRRYPQHIFVGCKHGEELARHYASADVFLFPSLTETFGNVTLEAMASGLAVVAYRYAAAGLYLEHGKTGLLAPYGESRSFIALTKYLGGVPEDIRRLGVAARETAEGLGWDAVCDRFDAQLRQVARGEIACPAE